ncbi:MAG TPA: hydrogenase iron-sulfur subunit [bacterium]|nr:hydrogenase iron-sulfur subunit [bacterium]
MQAGLFISRDNGRISETIDTGWLAAQYAHLAVVHECDDFFSEADYADILKIVSDRQLDSVIFAGNSPKHFERVEFGSRMIEKLIDAGLNENAIAYANIREQVAYPHRGTREAATQKAKLLIDVALARLENSHQVKNISVSPHRSVALIGVTAGSVVAANQLIQKGYDVYIIDKKNTLSHELENDAVRPFWAAIRSAKKMHYYPGTDVRDVAGWCGDYSITLLHPDGSEELCTCGGILLSVNGHHEWIKDLRPILQLDVDDTGLLKSREKALISGQTKDEGVWFIPYVEGAGFDHEMSSASMAVLSLTTILDQNAIEHPVHVSEVDPAVCGGCGTCVKTCAFAAASLDVGKKLSSVDPRRCKGCGNCVVSCPTGARDLINYPEKYIFKAIDILSQGIPGDTNPRILAILCNGCGYPASDATGELAVDEEQYRYPTNILPLRVECGGNVDTQYILMALQRGFDGVAVTICRDGHCHHIVGNVDMERRLSLFREVLRSRAIQPERMRIIKVSPHEGEIFSQEINTFVQDIKSL